MVDALPSARRGGIEPLAPSIQDVTRDTMDEGVVDDSDFSTMVQMEAEEPEYQFEYAGQRYEGTTKFMTDPVPAAEYEEPVNEVEYAGPIYEPGICVQWHYRSANPN
ncbi:hypothetical protein B0H14DRAFT_2578956 [Mycena olivaceomarginata]|nr:hypothetical protein B0H14DRAFT_2578956 [Mycena olivaceomarginata]